ncbi:hypothetical protein BASA50_006792 [Batrachochytrium salamandrivorans]|uniref:Uncharacterized protein n=1 Tax=Batrachochytrium salamandrivorans TaxID=1357716 RepID=A0ABQ8F8T0_9FUNG|nr:hypothetical protein BASA60_003123 [Batrachochytrium salamandrivorans]KAH6594201.1 hypothetical protein BASA50_006792 [Batrachochytrium salamandrivorans]
MDQRYSNATATELAIMDRVCIICREEMIAVPGNAPLAEAVGVGARAAVGVAGTGGVAHRINPQHSKTTSLWPCISSPLSTRQSVIDIPAQAPVQPAIVNPVDAVNPIATNGNNDMLQPAGAVHPHQYPQALPAANASWWS